MIGPSVEAIGDMQVITNGASAEYGRAAGGIVDLSLKSGTNQLHGVLFEILQNTDLDANRWENNLVGVASRSHSNKINLVQPLAAPIIKNKLFIFGDYQGTRIATSGGTIQNLGYGGFYTIPTAATRGRRFLWIGRPLRSDDDCVHQRLCGWYACRLGGCFSCLHAHAFRGQQNPELHSNDPVAAKLAALYPGTNQVILTRQFPHERLLHRYARQFDHDQGDGRVDYHLNDANSIFGSISWANTQKNSITPFCWRSWTVAISTATANKI